MTPARPTEGRHLLLWPLAYVVIAAGLVLWTPTAEYELPPDTPWHLLMAATSASDGTVSFPDSVRRLDGQEIRLSGFLFPLEQGRAQQHFLLSAYPPSCNFCLSGGPYTHVEVQSAEPVRFTYDPIALRGTFELHERAEDGAAYRMQDAVLEAP